MTGLGTMGLVGVLLFGFIFFAGYIILLVFYLIALMRAMNALPNKPMPGGLAFLAFIPFFGLIWAIVFALITVVQLRKEFKLRNIVGDAGLVVTIVFYSLLVLGTIANLGTQIATMNLALTGNFGSVNDMMGVGMGLAAFFFLVGIAELVFFIIHWVKLAGATKILKSTQVITAQTETIVE